MSPPRLLALEVPSGSAAVAVLPRVEAALDGSGPALLPYAAGSPAPGTSGTFSTAAGSGEAEPRLPDGLAIVVGTSGSTGRPKLALLTARALRASAQATHRRLGGPGGWVLALPAHHVAGIQVLVRSVVSGVAPLAVDTGDGFTAAAFAATTARLSGPGRHYTALVPTQLDRLLRDADGAAALRRYDAVLVGAAAAPAALLAEAERQEVRVVTTYGMSETAGGCVYDGVPLDCSAYRLDGTGGIELGGDTLAEGYLGDPALTAAAFTRDDDPGVDAGPAWFRTDDIGFRDDHGRLVVEGRVDDLITTGGLKVSPRLVEHAVLAHLTGVREALVVGVDDPEWGQRVGLAVVLPDRAVAPTVADLRARLRDILPAHAIPTRVVALPRLPFLGPGKPDRAAVSTALSALAAEGGTIGH